MAVELAYGASGFVTNSTIQGNSYNPSCDNEDYLTACDQATDILLYEAGPSVTISNNKVSLGDLESGYIPHLQLRIIL